jgi:predicted secreted protein
MATNAAIGHRNLFQILDTSTSPDTWTTVAEVTNITPPSYARDAQDATHTESTDGFREFIAGLSDAGEMSCELNLVPDSATMDLVLETFDVRTLQQVRVLFADGTQTGPSPTCSRFTCSAIITGFAMEAPLDDKMAATLTAKISGKPTFVRAT